MTGWTKICCAIDFSDSSRAALHEAAELARRLGAELTLVHIHETTPLAGGDVAAAARLLEHAAEELRRKLDDWRADAERTVNRPVRVALFSGKPSVELATFARAHGFDAIVLGTHGRRGLARPSRFVPGSVVDRVVHGAPCPVIVVHDDAPAQGMVGTSAAP